MQHLDALMRKSEFFLSNNLVSIDKEASNSGKEYYLVGKNKISVWIDEHGRFNCSNCGGFKKDAICSHVLASLIFRKANFPFGKGGDKMPEFKTLKEINLEGESFSYTIKARETYPNLCAKQDLRAEAIKHLKYIEKNYLKEAKNNTIYERGLIARGKIDFIKHFFNITEKDLEEHV